jgi:hypothetical protein
MSSLPLDPDLSLRVALTLLHFTWQGLVLAAGAAAAGAALRGASSTARYRVLLGAMALMVAAPAVTFVLLVPQDTKPGSMVPSGGRRG